MIEEFESQGKHEGFGILAWSNWCSANGVPLGFASWGNSLFVWGNSLRHGRGVTKWGVGQKSANARTSLQKRI